MGEGATRGRGEEGRGDAGCSLRLQLRPLALCPIAPSPFPASFLPSSPRRPFASSHHSTIGRPAERSWSFNDFTSRSLTSCQLATTALRSL